MVAASVAKVCKWHVRRTNSGWFYPAKIRVKRALGIQQTVVRHQVLGLSLLVCTFTLSYRATDALTDL